ncbi:MAG TPA: DUF2167 domain-containing protein [Rudaea sp.]|jgi:hypothetical protein|uniref:DUF2167 domain-containing protein n=1 Tax=Rudaea sp. TaxID=2136325 RepID=UPI002F91CE6D
MMVHLRALFLCLSLAAGSSVAQPAADEPPPADAVPQRASPQELRHVASRVTFYRGRFERTITGYTMEIPAGFHLIDSNDARLLDAALGRPFDKRLVASVMELNLALTDPQLWLVRVRWMNEGLVVASAGELDAKGLLDAARSQTHVPRLAGSGGTLQRFVVPPTRTGAEVDWVEERLPEGAKTTVFDCHALHLARKGVLEFSIVGASAGLQKTCLATVREFAQSVSFDPSLDYPAVPGSNFLAPYSLSGLIAQTQ